MNTIPERIATLEEKTDSLEQDSSDLAKAVAELNKTMHQGRGALRLFIWISGVFAGSGFLAWIISLWHKN